MNANASPQRRARLACIAAAFMLVAAGQIEPVLAGLAGLLLLSLAGLLFLELRKVRL